jgi:prepilin-type N-terminal cleavage/methylation domain-containing protein
MNIPSSSPRRSGFTLIELMVAMAITTIIVGVLISITAIALDTWTRSRSEIRAARQAKAMADTMARDFEALVTRRGNNFQWLHAESEPDLPGPTAMRSSNASELIFFTAATDRYEGAINTADDRGGDVSCVSYRLQYQDPIAGNETAFSTFALYRLLVNPDETFEDLLGKESLDQAFSNYESRLGEVENFVCENIYQFTITFNVEVTQAATGGATGSRKLTVPVSLGPGAGGGRVDAFRIMGTGLDLARSPSSSVTLDELKAGRLASMQVSLTVLSDFGMEQMRRRTFPTDAAKAEFLAKNSFQYSKLVELPGM